MRRTLVAVTCLLLLGLIAGLAPARAQDATPAATPPGAASPGAGCVAGTEERNAEIARQWETIWGTEDSAALETLAQPDLIHHWGQGEDTSSVGDFLARIEVFATAFPDLQTTIDEVIADGDYVVIRWTAAGTQVEPFFDQEATGVAVTWTGINLFRFECGLVAESWNEADGLGLRARLTGTADPIAGDPTTPAAVATPAADCAPMTEQEVADVASRWSDVWHLGDVDLYDALAAPDSVHHWGLGQDTTSLDDFKGRIGDFFTAFPDMRSTVAETVVQDDLVAIRWSNTGTQTGPIFGFEPTGAEVTWNGINIFRVACGQVVESWSEADGLGLRAQLEAASGAATPAP